MLYACRKRHDVHSEPMDWPVRCPCTTLDALELVVGINPGCAADRSTTIYHGPGNVGGNRFHHMLFTSLYPPWRFASEVTRLPNKLSSRNPKNDEQQSVSMVSSIVSWLPNLWELAVTDLDERLSKQSRATWDKGNWWWSSPAVASLREHNEASRSIRGVTFKVNFLILSTLLRVIQMTWCFECKWKTVHWKSHVSVNTGSTLFAHKALLIDRPSTSIDHN